MKPGRSIDTRQARPEFTRGDNKVVHIDDGFDFLGFRIQRRLNRSTGSRYVYTYPSKRSLLNVKRKVKTLKCRSTATPPHVVLLRINAVLRGWCNYFRHGVSKRTFGYLDYYVWHRVAWWLRKRHGGMSAKDFRRRYCSVGSYITVGQTLLFRSQTVIVSRYRCRGQTILSHGMDPPVSLRKSR